jgi:DnaK suppressor protein
MLRKKKQKYFRALLHEKLEELRSEKQQSVTNGLFDREEGFDFCDKATAEYDRSWDLHMKARNRNLVRKIMNSLEKLKDGTYGICEECGHLISEKRLQARPTATLCIQCKEQEEWPEKKLGSRVTRVSSLFKRRD